jgi:hypothetical protein
MQLQTEHPSEQETGELIAVFGRGRLLRVSRLRLELHGGSKDDEIEALTWVSMFMPDTVLGRRQPVAA